MNNSDFKKTRHEAMMSLSADKFWRLLKSQDQNFPDNKMEFWKTIHKARMLCPGLPASCNRYSKKWLKEFEPTFDEQEMAAWL